MGRKPLPTNLKRSIKTQVMLTQDEFDLLQEAVGTGSHATVSDLIRDAAAKLAKRIVARQ